MQHKQQKGSRISEIEAKSTRATITVHDSLLLYTLQGTCTAVRFALALTDLLTVLSLSDATFFTITTATRAVKTVNS